MAQPRMSPENVKRVFATAKMATHCRLSNDPVWRKIVNIDEVDYGGIDLANDINGTSRDPVTIFVKMFEDPYEILFCRMEEVPLVGQVLTPAQELFQKLSHCRQELLKITNGISSIKHLDKTIYTDCLLELYLALGSVVKPAGVTDQNKTYAWFAKQGCSNTTAALAVALLEEIQQHRIALHAKSTPLHIKQSTYEGWDRRFDMLELVMADLSRARPT